MRRTRPKFRTAVGLACLLACLLTPTPATRRASASDFAPASARSHSFALRAAATSEAATTEERLAVFDDVWRTVGERYYDPAMNGVDWAAARAEFRPQAAGGAELYGVLRRMLARLRDPHTRVHAPGERADWRELRYVSVGVRVRELEGEFLVTEVARGSEAERAGVRAGDEVRGVDGEPAASVVARRLAERTSAASPATARALAVSRMFEGEPESFVTVLFRSNAAAGEKAATRAGAKSVERSVRLRRVQLTRVPELSARREGGFAVVRFNLFTPETAAALARALREDLRGARGFVIDLRENGGGQAEAMTDIASAFLPPGTRLGRFTDRAGRAQLEPRTRTRLLSTAEQLTGVSAPVVVLTGARTASASEVLAAAFKERRRATVLGENTCGCVLGIRRRHKLPDGGTLEISEMDFRTATGERLEGEGVAPDELVRPTRRDLASGHDRALARALELLKSAAAR